MIRQLLCVFVVVGLAAFVIGCGPSDPTAEELGIASAEVQDANSARQDLEGLQETLDGEGPRAAAESAVSMEENMAALVESAEGSDHADTYQKIAAGIAEIKGMSDKGAIQTKLDELKTLADGLPK